MMRRILIIAFYFSPVGTAGIYRVVRFVRYLPNYGWKPVVLTIKPDYYDKKFFNYDSSNEVPQNTLIYRTPIIEPIKTILRVSISKNTKFQQDGKTSKDGRIKLFFKFFKDLLVTPDDKIWWAFFAIPRALRIIKEHKINIVYTTGGPFSTHLIGLAIKKLTKKPWVVDFRDPWYDNPIFKWEFETIKKLVKESEKKVLKNADLVIANNDILKEKFIENYGSMIKNKIFTITNGYDSKDFEKVRKFEHEKFTITYTGVLYEFHSITPFLKGLRNLLDNKPELSEKIQVLIIGPLDGKTEAEVKELKLHNVIKFLGPKIHAETISYMVSSHILLVTLTSNENRSMFIPAKVFEYSATRVPILSISPEGALADLIRRQEAGRVIHPADIRGISEAINSYYEYFTKGNLKLNDNNIEHFDCRNLTKKFTELLNRVSTS